MGDHADDLMEEEFDSKVFGEPTMLDELSKMIAEDEQLKKQKANTTKANDGTV